MMSGVLTFSLGKLASNRVFSRAVSPVSPVIGSYRRKQPTSAARQNDQPMRRLELPGNTTSGNRTAAVKPFYPTKAASPVFHP